MAKGNFAMVKLFLLVVSFFCLITIGGELPGDNWKASSLQAGDVLSISVFRVEEFSRTVRIEENGVFSYPLCGEIQAAGKTAREIGKELESLVKARADPHVGVCDDLPRRVYFGRGQEQSIDGIADLWSDDRCRRFRRQVDLRNRGLEQCCGIAPRSEGCEGRCTSFDRRIGIGFTEERGDDFLLCPEDTLIVPKAPPSCDGFAGNLDHEPTASPPLFELVIRAGG